MIPFFANKEFYPRFSLDISQPTNNQEAYNIAKHMEDILEQLRNNLLISQEAQKMRPIFIELQHPHIK